MTAETLWPILAGKKALVCGIANDQSIAYGCAKAFRELGADLAITYVNEKSRQYVEPIAKALVRSYYADMSKESGGACRRNAGACR